MQPSLITSILLCHLRSKRVDGVPGLCLIRRTASGQETINFHLSQPDIYSMLNAFWTGMAARIERSRVDDHLVSLLRFRYGKKEEASR